MNNKNVAILGGTFDPIHNGHLIIAEQVANQIGFTDIKFIPNNTPPHKSTTIASSAQRLAMLNLALTEHQQTTNSKLQLSIDLCEINRSGKSYMVDTVHFLKQQPEYHHCNIWLILGLDAFYSLPQWHDWQKLLSSCNFIVMKRELAEVNPASPTWALEYIDNNLLLHADTLYDQDQTFNGKVIFIDIAPIQISATRIRALFKNYPNHQLELQKLLPHAVIDYILDNKLYII